MAAEAVLGISLGSRRIGIAVQENGRLVHWQMQTFPGAWSHRKLKRIILAIFRHVELHAAGTIVIKIPDVFPTSKAFSQLIGCLNLTAISKKISIRYYTLSELKQKLGDSEEISRICLIESIVKLHPELLPEYQRENRNKERYYFKLFEAVLCTEMYRWGD